MQNNQLAIYTRFNLPLNFKRLQKPVNLDEHWLKERVILFNKYCLPSFLNQTSSQFKWFVCFDERTPVEIVEAVCREKMIIPIFAQGQREALEKSLDYFDYNSAVTTVRVDSDDSISKKFIELLHQYRSTNCNQVEDSAEAVVLSFPNGCEYDCEDKVYYNRYYQQNPFIALCEKYVEGRGLSGIFSDAHFRMHRRYVTLQIPTQDPMWRINVHGGNVANEIKGDLSKNDYSLLF